MTDRNPTNSASCQRCSELEALVSKYEKALETIAAGASIPAEWGKRPRCVDVFHRAVAEIALRGIAAADAMSTRAMSEMDSPTKRRPRAPAVE